MSDVLPVSDYHPSPPAPSGWTDRAACRGEDPDLFYPPEGERGGNLALRELVAKRICATCPVLEECAGYALASTNATGCGAGSPPPSGSSDAAGQPEPGQSGYTGQSGTDDEASESPLAAHRSRPWVIPAITRVSLASVAVRALAA